MTGHWRTAATMLAIAALILVTDPVSAQAPGKVAALDMTLRNLFLDHVFWIRSLAVATRAGDSDQAAVAYRRALDNARAFGSAVGSFYGTEAGEKFARLFTEHVRSVRDYWLAVNGKDEAASRAAVGRMNQNASQIAAFLSSANPHLPLSALRGLLGTHVATHISQCTAIASGNWADEAHAWDAMIQNIDAISDALAQGIAQQFPGKFP